VSDATESRRHTARLVTVSFVLHGDDVLLIRHPADNDRFAGQWNGVGGHVEAGEDIRQAALRELREETGVVAPQLSLRGVVHESGLLGVAHVLFIFLGRATSRDVVSLEGLELRWQPIEKIEDLPLVHDAAFLLRRAIGADETFFVQETYDGGDRRMSLRIDGEHHDGDA